MTYHPQIHGAAATLPAGKRVYAIGDVHGRDDLLAEKHQLIRADFAARPTPEAIVIHLGDYVDRGPDLPAAIDRVMAPNLPGIRSLALKGNHEANMLRFLDQPEEVFQLWIQNGGDTTLGDFGISPPAPDAGRATLRAAAATLRHNIGEDRLAFLNDLFLSVQFGDYFFCHAGVRPGIPLAHQTMRDLLWIRDEFLTSSADFGKVVVHGHTPSKVPQIRANRIGIDTMAVFSGTLTCLVLEADTLRFL